MSIVINREEFGIFFVSEWTIEILGIIFFNHIGLRGIAEREAEAEKFMKK